MGFNNILNSLNNMSDHARLHEEVRYYFFQADDNATALRLAKEALQKGFNSPLYNYVVGFCYNNGNAVPLNKRAAGQYFKAAADCTDTNGHLLNDKYADECRIILSEDFVCSTPEYVGLDVATVMKYCESNIRFGVHTEDAKFYLAKIYGRAQYGVQNKTVAMNYINALLQSSNPQMRAKASALRQELNADEAKKGSFFSRWF